MRFILKAVLFLAGLGALALLGFAAFSDLSAPVREISLPVEAQ